MAVVSTNLGSVQAILAINTDATPLASVGVQAGGTFSATVQLEASVDGVNWFSVFGMPVGGGAAVSNFTAGGQWSIPVYGYNQVRLRVSAYTSGAAAVALDASGSPVPGLYASGGGGVDTFEADGTATAPTASTSLATVTPGVAGRYAISAWASYSQGTPAAADINNIQVRKTATGLFKLPMPGAAATLVGPCGPFNASLTAANTVNAIAVANATAAVNYNVLLLATQIQ